MSLTPGRDARDYAIREVPPGRDRAVRKRYVRLAWSTRRVWTPQRGGPVSQAGRAHVAHYIGQAELAQAIQDGLEAHKAGDDDTAAAKLGRAVALAHQSGNQDTAKVVDVIDAATRTVRLKAGVTDADEMALDTRSSKTIRVRK